MHFPASGKWLTDGLFHPKTQDQRGLIKETVSQIGVGKNQYIPLPANPPLFNLLKCFGHRLTFFTNLLLLHLPWNGNCRHFDKWIERLSTSSGALQCFPVSPCNVRHALFSEQQWMTVPTFTPTPAHPMFTREDGKARSRKIVSSSLWWGQCTCLRSHSCSQEVLSVLNGSLWGVEFAPRC